MRRIGPVVAVLGLALLTGCNASEPAEPSPTASPSPNPSAETPSPTPTPTATGASDLSDPELGVIFTEYPTDTDEDIVAAVETYMLFEKEFWRALTTNTVPPGPWVIATDDAIAWIQAQVGPNAEQGWAIAGTLRTTAAIASSGDGRLSLDVCRDWSDTHFIHVESGDTATNDDLGLSQRSRLTLDLIDVQGTGWKVDSHELTGEC